MQRELEGVHVHGCMQRRVAANLNLSFEGIRSDTLQAAVPALAISGGAACSSGKPGASHVLSALGVAPARIHGAIRIGLGHGTSAQDVETAGAALVDAVRTLRAARR